MWIEAQAWPLAPSRAQARGTPPCVRAPWCACCDPEAAAVALSPTCTCAPAHHSSQKAVLPSAQVELTAVVGQNAFGAVLQRTEEALAAQRAAAAATGRECAYSSIFPESTGKTPTADPPPCHVCRDGRTPMARLPPAPPPIPPPSTATWHLKMTGHMDTPILCPVKTSQKNDGIPCFP